MGDSSGNCGNGVLLKHNLERRVGGQRDVVLRTRDIRELLFTGRQESARSWVHSNRTYPVGTWSYVSQFKCAVTRVVIGGIALGVSVRELTFPLVR